jgi:hypothetical protein
MLQQMENENIGYDKYDYGRGRERGGMEGGRERGKGERERGKGERESRKRELVKRAKEGERGRNRREK